MKIRTIFGGKDPHPNWLVGGVPCAINIDRAGDLVTANVERWDPETWPSSVQGVGFTEAPRGALGHWLKIENTRIANYQCVVPTTWNGSPRDEQGNIGAFEAALMNAAPAAPL